MGKNSYPIVAEVSLISYLILMSSKIRVMNYEPNIINAREREVVINHGTRGHKLNRKARC